MDWGLVLLSQGIETVIERAEDGAGWGLLVAGQDYETALDVLRLYQLENRRWPWRQELFQPGLLFDWASLAWVLLVGLFFWLSNSRLDLRAAGEMDNVAVAHGQWWRLFTAIWLHADTGHLAANVTIGCVLLGLTMGRYGTGVGLLAAYLAGAGGNLLAWALSTGPRYSLGASGMVMGCLGLLAVQSVWFWQRAPRAAKYLLSGILAGVMLFILLGVAPGTDVLAHLGGFLSGLFLGCLLSLVPSLAQRTTPHLLSGLLFALLVLWPWWLAFAAGFAVSVEFG